VTVSPLKNSGGIQTLNRIRDTDGIHAGYTDERHLNMPHTNSAATSTKARDERAGRLSRADSGVRSNAAREDLTRLSSGSTALTPAHTGVKPQVRGLGLDMASRGLA